MKITKPAEPAAIRLSSEDLIPGEVYEEFDPSGKALGAYVIATDEGTIVHLTDGTAVDLDGSHPWTYLHVEAELIVR